MKETSRKRGFFFLMHISNWMTPYFSYSIWEKPLWYIHFVGMRSREPYIGSDEGKGDIQMRLVVCPDNLIRGTAGE